VIVRRGQSTRTQPANGEGHTLTKEIGEIVDVGDCEVSARSSGDTYAGIEVKNVLGRNCL